MAFRRRTVRRIAPKRKWVWAHHNEQFAAGTNAGVDLLNDYRTRRGILAGDPGLTVSRVVGNLQFSIAPTVTLDVASGVVIGILKESRLETSATIQKPLTEPNHDWMWREWVPMSHYHPINSTVANTFLVSHAIDVQVARKLEEIDESLWFAWEATGGLSMAVFADLRIGLKLP